MKRFFLFILTVFSFCGWAGGQSSQDLYWFKYVLNFSELPQDELLNYLNPNIGEQEFRLSAEHAPWAGNYFPMQEGGVASRWRVKEVPSVVLSKEAVNKMTAKQRRNLSPTEKYDILMGYYDFRTTQHEMQGRGPLRPTPPQEWEGFCNGVRCAGLMTEEPKYSIKVKSESGIELKFSPADLKALAGASYFYVEKYAQIGAPTKEGIGQSQPNPAVFDLALRYHLAKFKKGFVIDSHLGAEIWNETVVGYKRTLGPISELTNEEKLRFPVAQKKVLVTLVLDTLGEVDIKDSNKPTKKNVADGTMLTTLETGYTLYLDKNGLAFDGKWHNTSEERGVDFAWFMGGKGADSAYAEKGGNPHLDFEKIQELIHESAHPRCAKALL